jgi:hypothetical protein
MIHRRTVVAIIVLFTLALVFFSPNDSLAQSTAQSTWEKNVPSVRGADGSSNRLGGSVLTTTGDPDEPSTCKRNTTGNGVGTNVYTHWRDWFDEPARLEGRRNLWRFAWMILMTGVVGVF